MMYHRGREHDHFTDAKSGCQIKKLLNRPNKSNGFLGPRACLFLLELLVSLSPILVNVSYMNRILSELLISSIKVLKKLFQLVGSCACTKALCVCLIPSHLFIFPRLLFGWSTTRPGFTMWSRALMVRRFFFYLNLIGRKTFYGQVLWW